MQKSGRSDPGVSAPDGAAFALGAIGHLSPFAAEPPVEPVDDILTEVVRQLGLAARSPVALQPSSMKLRDGHERDGQAAAFQVRAA